MYKESDIFYQIGKLETYKYSFQNTYKEFVHEYIHCIVKERLQEWDGSPRKIKVSQIHNLEEYFSNPDYNNYSERTLMTENIEVLVR